MTSRKSKCDGGSLPKRSRHRSPQPMHKMERPAYRIERVVGRRLAEGNGTTFEYRIKWLGYGEERNTWEPESALHEYRYWLEAFNRAENYKAELEALKSSMIAPSSSKVTMGSASYDKAVADNNALIKENNFIKSKLRAKDTRIGELEAELRMTKISRRVMQTKLTVLKTELRETFKESKKLRWKAAIVPSQSKEPC